MRRVTLGKYLTPLALAAAVVLSGCAQEPTAEKQSLFEIAQSGVEQNICALAPHATIELAFPALTSYLNGEIPTVEEKAFSPAGADARTVSCFWDTAAGPVTLSVVRGESAPQFMLNGSEVTFKFEGVSFVPLSFAEAVVVKTAEDEAVFLSAPGLVPRSALIEAARLVVLPSLTKIPDLPLPVGARSRIDVFRTSLAIDACGAEVSFDKQGTQNAKDPAFVSHGAGMVDLYPQSDADAYSLATLKRVLNAASVRWDTSSLQVGETPVSLSCENAPAQIWGFIWEDPTSDTPSAGPLTIDEFSKTAVTSNAWRALLMISPSKPSSPSRIPAMPDVSYSITQTTRPS
jgi:hypothetical protein